MTYIRHIVKGNAILICPQSYLLSIGIKLFLKRLKLFNRFCGCACPMLAFSYYQIVIITSKIKTFVFIVYITSVYFAVIFYCKHIRTPLVHFYKKPTVSVNKRKMTCNYSLLKMYFSAICIRRISLYFCHKSFFINL